MTTDDAVAHGIKATAGVVTSAAVVMVARVRDLRDARRCIDFKQLGVGLGGRGPDRRDDRPRRAAAGDDEAARRLELVPAELARVAAARSGGEGEVEPARA